jgi:hypothetical protein
MSRMKRDAMKKSVKIERIMEIGLQMRLEWRTPL